LISAWDRARYGSGVDADDADSIEREERGIYVVMLLAGLPIAIALGFEGRSIDGGNTVVLLVIALAAIGLGAGLRSLLRHRIPRATARLRKS
jgi:hypothetical protein